MNVADVATILAAAGDLTLKGAMALAIYVLWAAWRLERAGREAARVECDVAREKIRLEHAKDLRDTIAAMDGQMERVIRISQGDDDD